jgi:hypothetical protein
MNKRPSESIFDIIRKEIQAVCDTKALEVKDLKEIYIVRTSSKGNEEPDIFPLRYKEMIEKSIAGINRHDISDTNKFINEVKEHIILKFCRDKDLLLARKDTYYRIPNDDKNLLFVSSDISKETGMAILNPIIDTGCPHSLFMLSKEGIASLMANYGGTMYRWTIQSSGIANTTITSLEVTLKKSSPGSTAKVALTPGIWRMTRNLPQCKIRLTEENMKYMLSFKELFLEQRDATKRPVMDEMERRLKHIEDVKSKGKYREPEPYSLIGGELFCFGNGALYADNDVAIVTTNKDMFVQCKWFYVLLKILCILFEISGIVTKRNTDEKEDRESKRQS